MVGREWDTNIPCDMGMAGAVQPTEATETPVNKQAGRQETPVDADNSEGTFVVHFITEWPT